MSFIEKQNYREQAFLTKISKRYRALSRRRKAVLEIAPRIVFFMFFVLLFSGIIFTKLDALYLIVAIVVLFVVLIIVPWRSIIGFFYQKF
jgi:uncharacterized ion transporter superfamily protein YfcC